MLILTRKIDQAIIIRENILVRILGIDQGRVKIGISAPEEVLIFREEVIGTKEDGHWKPHTKKV
jgi:carbon storage regulator